jgi:hypothetical protein
MNLSIIGSSSGKRKLYVKTGTSLKDTITQEKYWVSVSLEAMIVVKR